LVHYKFIAVAPFLSDTPADEFFFAAWPRDTLTTEPTASDPPCYGKSPLHASAHISIYARDTKKFGCFFGRVRTTSRHGRGSHSKFAS